jgi:hypothetical protein
MPELNVTNTFSAGTTAVAADVNENFAEVESVVNALDGDNLATAVAEQLGLSETGTVRRGKSIIATEESRTNTAYGTLTTPDQVQSVVVPTDGLLRVKFSALVKTSVVNAGRVALFVGSNQVRQMVSGGAPVVADSGQLCIGANDYDWVFTYGGSYSPLSTDQSAGQASRDSSPFMIGVPVEIEVPAGTYDVSIQYKASSGSITAKERKLWVEAVGF